MSSKLHLNPLIQFTATHYELTILDTMLTISLLRVLLDCLTIFSGGVAGLVTCWFKLGGVPVPMFVESAFKAVHGGCIYYSVRKIVPSVDNAVTKGICTNVES